MKIEGARRPAPWRRWFALAAWLMHAAGFAAACESSQKIADKTIAPEPGVQAVVFVAKHLGSGACWHTSATDITQRHAPWSTFKIPHFLIALETAAVPSSAEVLRWDPKKRPAESYWPDAWRQDQSLGTAFQYSAAWPFQELVPRIGAANYKKWLERFQFGNAHVPPGRDDFWLGGPLAVSAAEQLAFLSCVATSGCGASADSVRALEVVALQDERRGLRLYAKTGSGPVKPRDFSGHFEGWYVGYIKDGKGVATAAFATYVRSDSYSALRTYRERISLQLLSDLGFWPR